MILEWTWEIFDKFDLFVHEAWLMFDGALELALTGFGLVLLESAVDHLLFGVFVLVRDDVLLYVVFDWVCYRFVHSGDLHFQSI